MPLKKSGVEAWLIFIAVITAAVTVYIRLRLMDMPLVRDEGGFAYAGQLILNGIQPFSAYYDNKMPGVYYFYAFFMLVLGQKIAAIRLGLMVINLLTAFTVFFIGKRVINRMAGIIAAVFFLAGSVCFSAEGVIAYTEHFAVFFALLSLACAVVYMDKRKISGLIMSGLFSGAAFLCKQSVVFILLFVFLYLVYGLVKNGKKGTMAAAPAALFIGSAILPLVILIIHYAVGGTLGNFIKFTVNMAVDYSQNSSIRSGSENLYLYFINKAGFFHPYIIAVLAAVPVIMPAGGKIPGLKFLAVFMLLSSASVSTGLRFYPHYFIFLLPAASLFGASIACALYESVIAKSRVFAAVLLLVYVVLPAAWSFNNEKKQLFIDPVEAVCGGTYPGNPFNESIKIAEFIAQNTSDKDRILVIGSEPQIYFYSRRRASTGYAFMQQFAAQKKHSVQMQEEALKEIEKNPPEFVVFVYLRYSWADTDIFVLPVVMWLAGKRVKDYEKTGVVDMPAPGETVYAFEKNAGTYRVRSGNFIELYKKRH